MAMNLVAAAGDEAAVAVAVAGIAARLPKRHRVLRMTTACQGMAATLMKSGTNADATSSTESSKLRSSEKLTQIAPGLISRADTSGNSREGTPVMTRSASMSAASRPRSLSRTTWAWRSIAGSKIRSLPRAPTWRKIGKRPLPISTCRAPRGSPAISALRKQLEKGEPDSDRVHALLHRLGQATVKISERADKQGDKVRELGEALIEAGEEQGDEERDQEAAKAPKRKSTKSKK